MLIADKLTQVFSDSPGADWFLLFIAQPDVSSHSGEPRESIEFLLGLDGLGWGRFFAERGIDGSALRRFDDLVALWLNHQDYRRLREMAASSGLSPAPDDVDELLAQWLLPEDIERLAHLVVGMRFEDLRHPICYALTSAAQAAQSALEFAQLPREFTDAEIAQMQSALRETVTEDVGLAAKGF